MYTLRDLSSDQLHELRQNYLIANQENVSWDDLANADSIVSMEELKAEYGTTLFSYDDFICTSDVAV